MAKTPAAEPVHSLTGVPVILATDPLTAALLLVREIVATHNLLIQRMSTEQAQTYAQLYLDDLKGWRTWFADAGLSRQTS